MVHIIMQQMEQVQDIAMDMVLQQLAIAIILKKEFKMNIEI